MEKPTKELIDIAPNQLPQVKYEEAVKRTPDTFPQGASVAINKAHQSPNFKSGVQGWRIDTNGNAEFNNGTFRGRFEVGGTNITISTNDSIQDTIDIVYAAGGGTVFLQPGTYTLTADVSIPSGVRLAGVSRDNVIIDCDGTWKVKAVGSNAYTTGTITLSTGDTTVVGSGTTFTSGMVGRYILLGQTGNFLWYEITAFTDTTHITIGTAYTGPDLSTDTYTIATINVNPQVAKLSITNATGVGLQMQYVMEPVLDDILVYDCGTGLDFDQVVYPLVVISADGNGVNANWNEVSGYEIRFSAFNNSTTGAGFIMTSCGNATFFDSSISGNTADGLNMTNCEYNAIMSVDISANGGQGVELVSGCNFNQFVVANLASNTSDGLKITATSDGNVFIGSAVDTNGGYGVNVAASNCDSNIISSNVFSGNSSGQINNSGTATVIRGNVGYGDNSVSSGKTSKDMTDNNGATTVIAHGLGVIPSRVKFTGFVGTTSTTAATHCNSVGSYDGTTYAYIHVVTEVGNAAAFTNGTDAVLLLGSGNNTQKATVTLDATNITLTWAKTNTPSSTAQIFWEAWR